MSQAENPLYTNIQNALVGTALYDYSFNIVGAAEESLLALYPGTPKNFDSLEEEQKYYCGRAKDEGLKVNCDSK